MTRRSNRRISGCESREPGTLWANQAPAYLSPQIALYMATVAGGLLGRVISRVVTELASWRTAFLAFASWTVLGALAMGYALPRQHNRKTIGWASAYRGMLRHFRDRRLVGAFIIGGGLFFAFIGIFTYLPYYLTAAPFRLSTGLVSSVYIVYLAGVIVAPLTGRLSARFTRRAIMAAGLIIAGVGVAGTMIDRLAVIVPSLVVLCIGMFTAQSTAPAFVNAIAREAKGGAGALYLTFYYIGTTIGSVLPGYAWQAWGWAGVVMICAIALLIALLADWLLCVEG